MLRWIFILCFAIFGSLASAQIQNFGNKINSHIFRFSDNMETVSVEDALGFGSERAIYRWMFRASYDHVNNSVIAVDASSGNAVLSYVDNLQTLTLGASYLFGYSKRILLGFSAPIHSVALTPEGAAITGGDAERTTVMGDASVYLKWRLTNNQSNWNFALMPRLILPTGDEQYLVSDGEMTYGLRALLDRTFGSFSLYSYLGYVNAGDAGFLSVNRGQRAEGGFGMFYSLSRFMGINAEINGDVVLDGGVRDNQNSLDAIAGMRFAFERAKLFVGTSLAGLQTSSSHEFGFYAGIKMAAGVIGVPIDPGPKVVVEEEDLVPVEEPAPVEERVQISETQLFSFDKALLRPLGKRSLDKTAAIIVHFQDRLGKIVIEGHTDTVGPKKYNQGLSEKRARAVRDYLISRGVYSNKLMAIGYGEQRPKVFPEKSKADRQKNRRAEFFVDEVITIREL